MLALLAKPEALYLLIYFAVISKRAANHGMNREKWRGLEDYKD